MLYITIRLLAVATACRTTYMCLDMCWYPMRVVQGALPSATAAPSPLLHVVDTMCRAAGASSTGAGDLSVSPQGNLPEPSSCMHTQSATEAQKPECIGAGIHGAIDGNAISCMNVENPHDRSAGKHTSTGIPAIRCGCPTLSCMIC